MGAKDPVWGVVCLAHQTEHKWRSLVAAEVVYVPHESATGDRSVAQRAAAASVATATSPVDSKGDSDMIP